MSAPRLPMMLVAFLLVAGLGLAWLLARDAAVIPPVMPTSFPRDPAMTVEPAKSPPAPVATDSLVEVTADPSLYINAFDRVFNAAGDLHALAVEVHPRALAGDAEAMWALHRVMLHCYNFLEVHGTPESIAVNLARIRAGGGDPAHFERMAQDNETGCAGFRAAAAEELGSAAQWYAAAVEAGQPLARLNAAHAVANLHHRLNLPDAASQVDTTHLLSLQPRHSIGDEQLAYERIIEDGLDSAAIEQELRAALEAALATGRGDVLFHTRRLRASSEPNQSLAEFQTDGAALRLVACARGYPCEPTARWVRELEARSRVPSRSQRDGRTLVLDSAPRHLRNRIEERAREILAHIEAGSSAELVP
jgi:hypothetical protein